MRTALIAVCVVLVLLVGGGVFLSTRLDAYLNENRGWIEEQAEAAIGREVSFGDLGVTLWGGLGASVGDLHVGEDPSYGDGDFVALERAIVRVKLLPALTGRYEVSSVVLRAPRIQVIQGPDGLSTDSLGTGAKAEETEGEAEAPDSSAAFLVALLDIEDGSLHYIDRSGPEPVTLAIEALAVKATDLSLEAPVDFEISARVLGADSANLVGQGRAGPLSGDGSAPVDVSLSLSPLPLDALSQLPFLASSLPEGASLGGSAGLSLELSGTVDALTVGLELDAELAALRIPETLEKPSGVPLAYEASGEYTSERFVLRSGRLRFGEAEIETEGEFGLDPTGRYQLRLRASETSLAGWDALLPALAGLGLTGNAGLDLTVRGASSDAGLPTLDGTMTLADVTVRVPEQPAITRLKSRIELRDGGVVVDESAFDLSGSPVSVSARIPDLEAPVVTFALHSKALRGDSIGLSEPGAESTDVLRDLDVEGTATPGDAAVVVDAQIRSAGGELSAIPYRSMAGSLHVDGEEAVVRDLTLETFGGRVQVGASYDLTETEKPGWTVALELAGIDAAELATSQLGAAGALIEGRLDTSLSLTGRGLDYAAIAEALTGSGKISLADGMLKKVNIGETVIQKLTGVPGLTNLLSDDLRAQHPRLFTEGETAFDALRSNLEIRDGRVFADQLQISAADFGIVGGGSIGLAGDVAMTTTFQTSPALARSLTGGGRTQQLLADRDGRISVPVEIGGSLDGIAVRPDLGFVQQSLARAATDAVANEAQNLLSNLLGGGSSSKPEPSPDSADGESEAEQEEKPASAPTAREALERGLGGLLGR